MSLFYYTALSAKGKETGIVKGNEVYGIVKSASKSDALNKIRNKGVFPLGIIELKIGRTERKILERINSELEELDKEIDKIEKSINKAKKHLAENAHEISKMIEDVTGY